ncbi:DegT/DnrJ/EryC1/StrS family aminotransferase, partial [Vibrio parahaemolyticus]
MHKQLSEMESITRNRLERWNHYQSSFTALHDSERIELLKIPAHCAHNAHNFIIKTQDHPTRTALMKHLR